MTTIYRPHPLDRGVPPVWVEGWGQDRYGVFVEVLVGEVIQRMRWIPPGQFTMGSPESELGRYDREVQHAVTLTEGFWLADTPCTQAAWESVMGENPSAFKTPRRPVESVSWEDAQRFLENVPSDGGPPLRLPAEAEWEYACRAETETATYAGDLDDADFAANVLNSIAWYGGNSGEGFELDNGFDLRTVWGDAVAKVEHTVAGTRQVMEKGPNPWGLYDMLGNVFEWCADWHADYEKGDAVDPTGPDMGTNRVIRGGSWRSVAGNCRAAYRNWSDPSARDDNLGFRLARDQGAPS